jgi:glycosyltransferase involved in cell wall biosynthesis
MTRTVLHVLGTAELGATGIARVVIASARALAGLDYRVVATFMDGDGPLVGRLIEAGIPADAVYWGGARNLRGGLHAWRHLRALAPDIVHQHFGGGYLRAIARAAGVPRIISHFHSHGTEGGGTRRPRHSALFADVALATSKSVAATVTGEMPQVIYPAVVPVQSGPLPALSGRPPVIGALSRLAKVKGYPYLLRAMPAVIAQIPEARLEIAGAGEDYDALRAEIDQLGLADVITLLGWQDDLNPLFARWRVFAAPSLMEGLGISILEAAMRGLPIVASRVGGVPELIEDGVTGLLVPPAEPQALADALVAMLTDGERASRLARAAAMRARTHFAPAIFEGAIREVYARL